MTHKPYANRQCTRGDHRGTTLTSDEFSVVTGGVCASVTGSEYCDRTNCNDTEISGAEAAVLIVSGFVVGLMFFPAMRVLFAAVAIVHGLING